MALLGCPFCQELRPSEEGRECPTCGVPLLPVERLPPSYEARRRETEELLATPPEHRRLPVTYVKRGRAALVVVALLGLLAFFAPWVHVQKPDDLVLSGFDLARHRAGWLFGGAVGWFVLLPVVITRRTIHSMRGSRVVAVMFSAMTVIEVVLLLATRPVGSRYVPVEVSAEWGLYATAMFGVIGVLVGARFGGPLDDIQLPRPGRPLEAPVEETSDGETVH